MRSSRCGRYSHLASSSSSSISRRGDTTSYKSPPYYRHLGHFQWKNDDSLQNEHVMKRRVHNTNDHDNKKKNHSNQYHAFARNFTPSTSTTAKRRVLKTKPWVMLLSLDFLSSFPTTRTLRFYSSSTWAHDNNKNNIHREKNSSTHSQQSLPFQVTLDTGKDLILSLLEEKNEISLKDAMIVWLQLLQALNQSTQEVQSQSMNHPIDYIEQIHTLNELMTMLVTTYCHHFPTSFLTLIQSILYEIEEEIIIKNKENFNIDLLHGSLPSNEILACLCTCNSIDAAIMGERLLQRLLQHVKVTIDSSSSSSLSFLPKSSKLSIFSFNSTLSCWKNVLSSFSPSADDTQLSLEEVESSVLQMWNEMKWLQNTKHDVLLGHIPVFPNRITIQTTLSIYRLIARLRAEEIKQGGLPIITSYNHAKEILENMIDLYTIQRNTSKTILPAALLDYSESNLQPSSSVDYAWKPVKENFHTLLSTLGYIDDNEWIQREAKEIFNNMKRLAQDLKEEDLNPDLLIYKTVIGLLLRSSPSSVKANNIQLSKNTDTFLEPVESNLPSTISDLVREAVDKFGWAPVDSKLDGGHSSSTFGHFLLISLANSGYPEEAYEILHIMLEEYHRSDDSFKANNRVKPNIFCWNAVMSSFALKGKVDRAVHVLHEIQDYHAAGHDDIRPDNISLSILLKLLLQQKDPAIGDKAVLILERMEEKSKNGYIHLKPDMITYATVIECVLKSRSDKAVEKARDMLMQRIMEYKSGVSNVRPDGRLFKRVTAAHLDRFPNGPFNTVETLFSQFESGEYIYLDDASEMYECYVTLLHQYCQKVSTFESLLKAEKLLSRLEDLHQKGITWIFPRTKHYNWVLDALAKQSNHKATKLAQDILSRMELRFETGITNVKPDSYSYSAVLLAIANGSLHQSRALEAETLLQHILHISGNTGGDTLSVQLTSIIFNNAIRAVERSGASDKAEKARKIIKAMTDHGLKPDTFTYNGAIRCCAYTSGEDKEKREAFDYAMSCLNQFRSSDFAKVDLYTYPAIFIACDKLISNNVHDLQRIQEIWRMCCEDGCVSDLMLSHLRKLKIPRETLKLLLQSNDIDGLMSISATSLPKRWTRLYQRRAKVSNK